MAYKNRRTQFERTLHSITQSDFKDWELIVVDDCSSPEHQLDNLSEKYQFKLLRIDEEDKLKAGGWINPCMTYNLGYQLVDKNSENIVVQNPECIHVGDVLSYINKNLTSENYISMSCFSLDQFNTMNCWDAIGNMDYYRLCEEVFNDQGYSQEGQNCWYCHPVYRPVGYHFCASFKKENIDRLGGFLFDSELKNGIGFDDDDLLARVKRAKLEIIIPENPMVIHLWHYTESFRDNILVNHLFNHNANIFRQKQLFNI